jgi:hypothetical protein
LKSNYGNIATLPTRLGSGDFKQIKEAYLVQHLDEINPPIVQID